MTSKARKTASIAMLLASISFVSPAVADGHRDGGWQRGGHGGDRHGDWHGGEGRHGGGHGGNVWGWGLLGLGLGLAIAAPYTPPRYYQSTYYQPAYYPQPQVVVQSPTYVEQRAPEYMPPPPAPVYRQQAPVSDGGDWWYRCRQPDGYYPYVRTCPSGWQRVAPTPPG
jgi:hypothetical protein